MGLIGQILEDPKTMLIFLLLALPGRLLAISAHEAAHGWVANRCGDPTARLMGRVTLNPLKHIDILGLLMMVFVGIGWAKPVPVNPRNFRHYRRDDLLVSLAGISMNLILFLICALLLYGFTGAALSDVPTYDSTRVAAMKGEERFFSEYEGEKSFFWEEGDYFYYVSVDDLLENAMGYGDYLIAPVYGKTAGYLFRMIGYCMVTNIMLAAFNLLPIPPLDGYHVLNDLVLKRSLYASRAGMLIGTGLMYALFLTGALNTILDAVSTFVFGGVGAAASAIYGLLGIL